MTYPAIRPVAADPAARPLTEAQSGLWYATRLDPANPIFNTAHAYQLDGDLDLARFARALDTAVGEAEALSLRFIATAEGAVQQVDPANRPRLECIDLSGAPDPEAAAFDAMRHEMATPCDPTRDPLAAERLYRVGPRRAFWYQRVHHLAIDGYGAVLLANRVAELYADRGAGHPLTPLSVVYEEDDAYAASERRVADAAFWRTAMKGAPEVVGLAQGRATAGHRFHRVAFPMDLASAAGVRALAERASVSWPDALTALSAAYCRRFAGAAEVVVGAPYMGRLGSRAARTPAMVMNVMPLRVAPDESAPLEDHLVAVSRNLVRARRHGRYRGEQLRRDLGLLGGRRRLYGPLINVLPFDKPPSFEGLETRLHVLGTGPIDDITFTFRGDAVNSLMLEVDANPDLYSLGETRAHGERLAAFLTASTRAGRLQDIPSATDAEAKREVWAFNASEHPVPATSLAALLQSAMAEHEQEVAVVFGDQTLSYAELDRRSAALAHALRARGAAPDRLVAVALPRSLELVVALVGVLRAGAAYLPLDVEHPPERIATILAAAEPVTVLAASDANALFGDRLLAVDGWPMDPGGDALPTPAPSHTAYVIYTSGSTGEPKGVVIEHQAIVNRLLWMRSHYGVDHEARVLQKTPATFDVSVWEFFLPLISGARLVVAPPGAHRDPAAIAALIRDQGVTDCHFVPSMLSVFLAHPASRGLTLQRIYCSGEELPAELRDRFHRTVGSQLHNLYGPTEAAVDVSFWPASAEDVSSPVPIGLPVWNTRLLVLDEQMRPVPPGMQGHLHLGGVQLARGYLGRPDLTAERFVSDPFRPGERLYRTGDLARRRPDGAVVFLGRSDDQVKVRGFRIELGEIEAATAASGLVSAVAVVAREDRAGDRRLVAYVVPDAGFSPDALRAFLAARLPDYMVPAAIVELGVLPTNANGKLDRAALPPPAASAVSVGREPATPTEIVVSGLFAEVLGLKEQPSADADFFDLGGDSLLAVRMMLHVHELCGRDLGLGALFEHPSVAALARRIDAGSVDFDNGLGPLIQLSDGDPALAPLFMVHPAGGIAWGYRTLARALTPRRIVYGVQAPTLDPTAPAFDSIQAMARDYVERLLAVRPRGPWHLAGWSVGGIIAQEMAVRLSELGQNVGLMAMFDSYPAECWRAQPEPDAVAALRSLLAIAGYDPEAYPELQSREAIIAFLRAGDSPLGRLPPEALDGVIRVVLDTNRLVRGHHHRAFGGVTTHIHAGPDHVGKGLKPEMWTPYSAGLDVKTVPFLHSQLTGPAASEWIAPLLDERMSAAETPHPRTD